MTRFVFFLVLGLLSSAVGAVASDDPVTIGIREDARPFAYYDAENDSYGGFLVSLCIDAVVARAGYSDVTLVKVSADERDGIFDGTGRKDIDLFCDPTTITIDRLRRIGDVDDPGRLSFTPIVFLANGSYLRAPSPDGNSDSVPAAGAMTLSDGKLDLRGEEPEPVKTISVATCVKATTSSASEEPVEAKNEDNPASEAGAESADSENPSATEYESDEPSTQYFAAGFLVGSTSASNFRRLLEQGALIPPENTALCPVEFGSHTDLIDAFCTGQLQYYFGDLDIIRAYHQRWVETVGLGQADRCPFARKTRPLSYEPYAFVVSDRVSGFPEAVTLAIYEIFHDETAMQLYRGHFGESPAMSEFLRQLFLINQIPAGQRNVPNDGRQGQD